MERALMGDSMKRGPLLEFRVEKTKKIKNNLNILKLFVLNVYMPWNEFPKVDSTKFENVF